MFFTEKSAERFTDSASDAPIGADTCSLARGTPSNRYAALCDTMGAFRYDRELKKIWNIRNITKGECDLDPGRSRWQINAGRSTLADQRWQVMPAGHAGRSTSADQRWQVMPADHAGRSTPAGQAGRSRRQITLRYYG